MEVIAQGAVWECKFGDKYFRQWLKTGSFWLLWRAGSQSMTRWRGSPGSGKAWIEAGPKVPWRGRRWAGTQRIGGKKGSKRHLLVDGHGVPLSLIVTGANRHDVSQLGRYSMLSSLPFPKEGNHSCMRIRDMMENPHERRSDPGAICRGSHGRRESVVGPRRTGAGLWKHPTLGLSASGKSWSGMRSILKATRHYSISLRQ